MTDLSLGNPVLRLLVVAGLLGAFPAAAEDCGSPCTITRAGLPTLRLVNTVPGVHDWDLETSAFGVELAPRFDSAIPGSFRVDHSADLNTLVIGPIGVGIGTTAIAPAVDLQINHTLPRMRLDDFSFGAGHIDLAMSDNTFFLSGNSGASIMSIDTRASDVLAIDQSGRVGIGGTFEPDATLHVSGDAIVEGDVALGSSRSLKTSFGPVSSSAILAAMAELPVAYWRYKTEKEGTRHIGPFAEDFQRIFGLGNGETISIVDAQGVAFAALRGLAESHAALEREIAAKDARIVELTEQWVEQRNDLLERLEGLERRLGSLSENR